MNAGSYARIPIGRWTRLLILVALILAGSATVPPAQAYEGDVTFISPTAEQTVYEGWKGPVIVQIDDLDPGTYEIGVAGVADSKDDSDMWVQHPGGVQTYTFTPATITQGGAYYAYVTGVTDDADGYGYSDFDVVPRPRPAAISGVYASPATFFPVVKDQYLDSTDIKFRIDRRARVAVEITNAAGQLVTRAALGSLSGTDETQATQTYRWTGLTRAPDGSVQALPPGTYFAQVIATVDVQAINPEDAITRSAKIPVVIATDRTWQSFSSLLYGSAGEDPSTTSRHCFTESDNSSDKFYLGCTRSKGRARAAWFFGIPDDAKDFEWKIRGNKRNLGGPGKIKITGERFGKDLFVVRAKVTGRRVLIVRKVELAYRYPVDR